MQKFSRSLWPGSSVSLFQLQKEVAVAHAECQQAEDAENGLAFVGFHSLPIFRGKCAWCDEGSAFWWLGGSLKFVGVLCAARPYAAAGGARMAQLRYLASLTYIAAWQLGLWAGLGLHAALVVGQGLRASSPFGVAICGLLLAAGASAHATSVRFFGTEAFADLERYASNGFFVQTWSVVSRRAALALCLLLMFLAGAATLAEGPQRWVVAEVIAWLPLTVQYHTFLSALHFCSLGLDAFALDVLNTPTLEGVVGKFDKLHAAMRRSAYAVQAGLTVFVTSLSAALFVTVYHLAFATSGWGLSTLPGTSADSAEGPSWSTSAGGRGNMSASLSVAAMALLGMHLLNEIARINAKCSRLPALIHSLNFGTEIDHDKWCVAAHIESLEAGFCVYNVPVTRWSVLKFGYFALAAFSFLLTRLFLAAR